MVQGSRRPHEVEVAQRATFALPVGIVLAAFLVLALGATIYDVGKWFAVW